MNLNAQRDEIAKTPDNEVSRPSSIQEHLFNPSGVRGNGNQGDGNSDEFRDQADGFYTRGGQVTRILEWLEQARFCGNVCLCALVTLVLGEERVALSYAHESGRTTTLVFGARDAYGKRAFTYTTNFCGETKGLYE
jgi:hypothetical protein